jgi:hypothetical protein
MGLSTTSLPAEVDGTAKGTASEGAEGGSIFPSAVPTLKNRFHNQNSELNNEGYDSKGGLPFFANEPDDNDDTYIKPLLDNQLLAAPPSPSEPAATALLTVMRLNVAQLKDELRKRGRLCAGRKSDLQDCLKEAILNNIPVSSGNEPPCQECMAGLLDITARWELLTPKDGPILLPENGDPGHPPPIEMDRTLNLKYRMKETFDCRPFTGTAEKMRYYLQSLR